MVLTEPEDCREKSNDGSSEKSNEAKTDNPSNSQYECNICLDSARDAVISMCGHLFCWPCLHKWIETRPSNQTCPVCKSAISKEKVIPLYGRNCTDRKDPRDKVPPRPQGQRTEAPRNNLLGFGGFEGLQVSFGIGAFPFSFLAATFNFNGNEARPGPVFPPPGTTHYAEEQFLSRIFLIIAAIFIIWILIA